MAKIIVNNFFYYKCRQYYKHLLVIEGRICKYSIFFNGKKTSLATKMKNCTIDKLIYIYSFHSNFQGGLIFIKINND